MESNNSGNIQYQIKKISAEGSVSLSIALQALEQALKDAPTDRNGFKLVQIMIQDNQPFHKLSINLPTKALIRLGEDSNVSISSSLGTVTLSSAMLKQAQLKASESIALHMEKEDSGARPSVNMEVKPPIPVHLSLPYAPSPEERKKPDLLVLMRILEDGTTVIVPKGKYDPNNKSMVIQTAESGTYVVDFRSISFTDLEAQPWAGDAIEALGAREVVRGTGNGNFAPDRAIKLAEFVVMLDRMLDLDAEDIQVLESAAGTLTAKDSLTREAMAILLARAITLDKGVAIPEADLTVLSRFQDGESISDTAINSVSWMVSEGIMLGDGANLRLGNIASRAESAVMLYRVFHKLY
ncbi:S-layer homology domain-containing protein [Paenibacillus sp. LHD-117]|uniref:S-layer homology domain-containing protein n=1 Tax=Paenibacillus sp. LHD-117 TaxID=3071412 RepID=UPI0027E0643C|nr:S-layer homology domain-containing protein [Paenibacillus sp. LHD-117]MDQ6420497.1 S-layer homology domain-containing protein [Paenibacillus sp. LHD-117]